MSSKRRPRVRRPDPVTGPRPLKEPPLLAIGLGLIVTVVALYGRVADHGFVNFDDFKYIVENPHVRQGLSWDGLKWAFTSVYLGNWHPLTWLSHMIDVQIFGLAPGAHHLVNLTLHAANALLLLLAIRFLTGEVWPSAAVAVLFAIHPLRVESVAWASERKDLLAGLFWMLTMLAYAAYTRKPSLGRYGLVLVAFALGLLAKPMLVTLPFVLLLLDLWPLGRWHPWTPSSPHPGRTTWARLAIEKTPLLLLAAVSAGLALTAQSRGGAVAPLDGLGIGARLGNALVAYGEYLAKTGWPSGLAVYYPHPAIVATDRFAGLVVPAIISGLAITIVTAAALALVQRAAYLLVGWLWFLGTLIPVIGLVQVGTQSWADRYAYLPLIGVYMVAAWGARDAALRWPRARVPLVGGFILAFVAYGTVTWKQVGYWRDSETLLRRALDVTVGNYVAHNNLANYLASRGQLAEAEHHYDTALAIKPNFAEAHNNLGTVLSEEGDSAAAEKHYRRALDLNPDYAKAHFNLGFELEGKGRRAEAEAEYEQTLRIDPATAEAHERLGTLQAARGEFGQASSHFREALAHKPDLVSAAHGLAWLLATCPDPTYRDGREAVRLAEWCASAVGQRDARVLTALAAAHAENGEFGEAVRWQSRAIESAPPEARPRLQAILDLYRSGRPYRERGLPAGEDPGMRRSPK